MASLNKQTWKLLRHYYKNENIKQFMEHLEFMLKEGKLIQTYSGEYKLKDKNEFEFIKKELINEGYKFIGNNILTQGGTLR